MDYSLPSEPEQTSISTPPAVSTPPIVEIIPPLQVPSEKPKSKLPWLFFLIFFLFTVIIGFLLYYQKYYIDHGPEPTPIPSPVIIIPPTPTPSPDPYLNWKSYNNIVYKYSLKYPPTWKTQAIGAGAGGKEAQSNSNGLDISETGVKKTYPYGVFTIQGFARSTESNYKQWTKSEIALGDVKATKYENLTKKDLKSVAIIIKTPDNKYLEILFRETPDNTNWTVFSKILSSFTFLDSLDPAGWKTYLNEKLQYQINYPTDFKVKETLDLSKNKVVTLTGKETALEINLSPGEVKDQKALETYYFMDSPITRTGTLAGQKANIYEFPNGYCDSGQPCSKPFITYVTWYNNRYYHLNYYGDTKISEEELLILSTFKFTK